MTEAAPLIEGLMPPPPPPKRPDSIEPIAPELPVLLAELTEPALTDPPTAMASKVIAIVTGDPTEPAPSSHSASHATAAIATSPHSAAAAPSRALAPGPSGLGTDTGRETGRDLAVVEAGEAGEVVEAGIAGTLRSVSGTSSAQGGVRVCRVPERFWEVSESRRGPGAGHGRGADRIRRGFPGSSQTCRARPAIRTRAAPPARTAADSTTRDPSAYPRTADGIA